MADNLDTPYSRREIFYKGILDQDPDSLPDPETREERYLKAIAEAYPTPVEATVTQDEGSSTTSVMSQKAVTDALDGLRDSKLDKTGTAHLADNLTPYSADSGATQSVPFINQGTGCGNGESIVDTGSYSQVKKKLGNTAGVNQQWDESKIPSDSALYSSNTYTANGVTFTKNGDGSITIQTDNGGATALTEVKIATGATIPLTQKHLIRGAFDGSNSTYHINYAGGARKATDGSIFEPYTYGYNMWISVESGAVITTPKKIYPQIIFLPLWFGSEGNIPSYLLSHPEDFGRYYSGSLAYNPGQLVNADGTVMRSIGRNLFDTSQNMTNNKYLTDTGADNTNNVWSYSDYIAIIPNTEYFATVTGSNPSTCFYDANKNFVSGIKHSDVVNQHFTTPPNAFYLRTSMQTSLIDSFVLSLYYPGESGYDTYYPYSVLAEVDTGSEVLRSAGAVADEKTPDGTITRRVGVVDLGTLTWTKGTWAFYTDISQRNPNTNVICSRYINVGTKTGDQMNDKEISPQTTSNGRIYITDANYSTSAEFKTAMSGVYLYYELATPTTEQGTPFSGASADNFAIDDFGSMYWTQTKGIPQGNEIFYPVDYKASLDTLLNMVDGDVEKLVTETELGAVADRIPEAPAEDGTYTFKATVADGVKTYAWVADE